MLSTARHLDGRPGISGVRLGLGLLLAVLVAGCAGPTARPGPDYRKDGPPTSPVDISAIPDAVPRFEPLCIPCLRPYRVDGVDYQPLPSAAGYRARGTASWYGREFHGRPTANGESYDMFAMTAAHPTLPIPSYARITNLGNGRSVVVRINDRGPFRRERLIDVSYVAAAKLGLIGTGSAPVELRTVLPGDAVVARHEEPVPADGVYLQVGAFADAGTAQRLATRLRREAFPSVSVHTADTGGRRLHRVRMGPLPGTLLESTLARLRDLGLTALQAAVP
ncbi:septal ring lytic transglycosylase RlpA family protein [Immundisolibacter sp.]|uniref:septal ring lytic transglycosylase RlpA family protein n=1 Tax=Immundisolibacter sp. TaxID=1934948 RepID=UPI003568E072